MRILLKIVGAVIVLAVVAAAAGLGYLYLVLPSVGAPETVTVTATPERLARGEYLAKHVTGCVSCHAERDWSTYSAPIVSGTLGRGGDFFGEPGTPVEVWSSNITPAALGTWTDGEIIRAITTGVSRDGTPLFPIMPYPRYRTLARSDVEAIVAYIRTLPAIAHDPPARKLGFPLPLVVRTLPQPAALRDSVPPASDTVAYGEYMTNAAACTDCHTPTDAQGRPLPGMDFAGGFELWMPGGGRVRVANITPDRETGIGNWSEEFFVQRFKAFEGGPPASLNAGASLRNTAMPWTDYAGMTREDLAAIYAYLRTLKPVTNRVERYPQAAAGGS